MNSLENPSEGPISDKQSDFQHPTQVMIAIGAMIAQLVLVGIVLLWFGFSMLTSDLQDVQSAVIQLIFLMLAVGWLVATLMGMWRGKNAAKGSAVVLQILCVAVGVTFIQAGATGGLLYGAIGLLVLAVVAFLMLFSKASNDFFAPE